MDETLHIALVQADLLWEQPAKNRYLFEQLFNDLPAETDLVVLPEMFATGFSMNVAHCAENMDGETLQWLKLQAKKLRKTVAGSLMIKENGYFFNRFVFVKPDKSVQFYDKRHLFSMGQEHEYFTPGKQRKVFQLKAFRIIPQICYDLRFPVFSRNQNDYDLLINCANWPAPRQNAWDTLLKARSIENQSYVAGVNRIGQDANGINYAGGSCIIDPKGAEISKAGKQQQLITAKLSLQSLHQFRSRFPAQEDADSFSMNL